MEITFCQGVNISVYITHFTPGAPNPCEYYPKKYHLKENAHKYGFILRYPKGKELITGFKYEPWHYRYVGIDVATIIYQNELTLEEYYKTLK